MLDRFASESMVAWYNRLLAREEWARTALAPYAGRSARIDAGPLCVFVAVAPGGTLVAASGTPDVTIALAPGAIAETLREPAGAADRLRPHVVGDAAFAQALTDTLKKLRPDPAEDLSRLFGDAAAERMVGAVHAAMHQARESAQRLAQQGADYLVAENPMLLGAQEWARFCTDLADLQARLGQLEQRVLAASGAQPPGGRNSG